MNTTVITKHYSRRSYSVNSNAAYARNSNSTGPPTEQSANMSLTTETPLSAHNRDLAHWLHAILDIKQQSCAKALTMIVQSLHRNMIMCCHGETWVSLLRLFFGCPVVFLLTIALLLRGTSVLECSIDLVTCPINVACHKSKNLFLHSFLRKNCS